MSLSRRSLLPLASAVALLLPALAAAQDAPRRPRREPRPPGVTRMLNARRALELTPRQLTQLDSIERGVFAERRALQERLRPQRDSMARRMAGMRGASRDSIRAAIRARTDDLRPQLERLRRSDSTAMAGAERLLTDPQRQKLREMRAEERGRQRGLREAQMRGRVREMPRREMPRREMPGRGMRRRPPGAEIG